MLFAEEKQAAGGLGTSNDIVSGSSAPVSALPIAGLGLTPGITVLTTRKSARNKQRPSGWKEGDQGHAGRQKRKKSNKAAERLAAAGSQRGCQCELHFLTVKCKQAPERHKN